MSRSTKKLTLILEELKEEYLDKLPEKIDKLKALTEKQDWMNLVEELHKLKGTGKTYGFPEISLICEALEKIVEKGESKDLDFFFEAYYLLDEVYLAYLNNDDYDLYTHPFAVRLLQQHK